ncbi:hypothetical protein RI138_11720 [Streptomyces sp. C11-1]|uniref:Integral membrane protein n=1 Tax=Streptomyces durocortorensis TaxID=2811104 RepID=A0ABY9VV39_9ACTN|nr:hypothetical protein [Streptomyces durocortorensis]WNF27450.1 hypothetical protein RI138_11720 [Streptomyces durocortorensis]
MVVFFVGITTLVSITAYLCSRLARRTRPRYTSVRAGRDVALAAIAAGIALYLWGLLHVLFLEDQEQAQECERQRPEGVPSLVGRRGDFLPLRLVCEASNGRDYSVLIPEYINPTIAVLTLLALLSAVASVVLHPMQRTASRKKG